MISDVTICVCDGLTEGVEYYFRVRAVNAIGHGDALTSPLPIAPKDPPKVSHRKSRFSWVQILLLKPEEQKLAEGGCLNIAGC